MAVVNGVSYSGSTFTIRELTGDIRTVELTGRGMPYRPFTLKGKQNLVSTWLPGNPIATATVLGPQEEPTELKGYWKDKYIGDPASVAGIGAPIQLNGNPVTTVRDAIQMMDDIRRAGQLLEVVWDVQVRQGFLTEFEATWQNIHDCEWSMHFEWISQGDVPAAALVAVDMSASDLQSKLLSQLNVIQGLVPPDIPASLSLMDTLNSAFQKLSAFVSDVSGATTNLASVAMTPLQVLRQSIAACVNIIGVVNDTVATLDNEVTISYNMAIGTQGEGALLTQGQGFSKGYPNLISGITNTAWGVGAAVNHAQVNLGQSTGQVLLTGRNLELERLAMTDRISAYAYIRNVRKQLYVLRSIAITGQAQFGKITQNTLQGVYVVKEFDDLRKVSDLYYNTPFNWQLLAQFNELETFDLTIGQVLLIPIVSTGEA